MTVAAKRRLWPMVRTVAPTLLALALLAWAWRWYAERWQSVEASVSDITIAWPWVLAGALALTAHAITAMVIWRLVLQASGVRQNWREAVDVFTPTLLARYIPGRIWANAARLALSRRLGVSLRQAGGAMVWEAGVALGTACVVAALTVGDGVDPTLQLAVRIAAAATVLLAIGLLLARHLPTGILPALGVAFVGWLAFGLAHLAIAKSIAPVGAEHLPLVMGAMALAWSAGYLAIVVPLGIGVRDAVLLVLLATLLEPRAALLFVALARLVQLAVDVSLTALWLLMRRRPQASTPSA